MKYIYVSQDHAFSIPLVPPADVSTVVWSLRDNAGVAMGSYTNTKILNDPGSPLVGIMVPAAAHAKTLSRESRFLIVNWESNGVRFTLTYPYVIVDFLPLRAQVSDVRTILSLNEAELDDAEIDLVQAAYLVSDDVGSTLFDAALVAGDTTTNTINQMIAYRSAVLLGPSLPTRISLNMAVEGNKFSRLDKIDPADFLKTLWGEYDRLRTELTGEALVTPVIFTRSVRPPAKFIPLCPVLTN